MDTIVRKRYRFSGGVQGVGFRWTCINKAMALGLTGWVRNERNGSVTVEVQGDQDTIDKLIMFMKRNRFIWVDSISVEDAPIEENEASFTVRYR